MSNTSVVDREYTTFVAQLKKRIAAARVSAARAVNRDLILLYWDIGRGILEKQQKLGWGRSVVETLAVDLQKEFPGMLGFSARNLWEMRRFYVAYSSPEFLQQLVAELKRYPALPADKTAMQAPNHQAAAPGDFLQQLVAEVPWGHHLLILQKVPSPAARVYYLQATGRLGWSRDVLLNQVKAEAYERVLPAAKQHNFTRALPAHLAEQAEECLKSSYNLEFLGIGRAVHERELEKRLMDHLRDFILELGYGFCYIGTQHRLVLPHKDYFIDLLFYHRFLKALVAVELKIGPFEPEFAGKMDFYLNLLNEREKAPDDNPSIGIILCAEKNSLDVEFSLKTKNNPIGVAEYHLVPKLPKELRGQLPSERQLLVAMKMALGGS